MLFADMTAPYLSELLDRPFQQSRPHGGMDCQALAILFCDSTQFIMAFRVQSILNATWYYLSITCIAI